MNDRDPNESENRNDPVMDYWAAPSLQSRQEPASPTGRFFAGVGIGYLISIVLWYSAFRFLRQDNVLALGAVTVLLLKCGIAAKTYRAGIKGFPQGLLVSIALVPLTGIGLIWALCSGLSLR
jgi:hypothetical protein